VKEFFEKLESADQHLFLLINGLHNPFFDKLMLAVSNPLYSIPVFLFLLFALYKAYPGWQMVWVLLAVGLSIILTDQLSVKAFKNVFLRYRPCYNTDIQAYIHLVKSYCGGKYGFVSSHAANFAGLGILFTQLLKFEYRKIAWVMGAWVVLIGYSRVYLGVHYPADVIGGFILGSIIGWLVYKLLQKILKTSY